jgi:hypothetical protein
VGTRKTFQNALEGPGWFGVGACVVEASKFVDGIETEGLRPSLGMSQAAARVVGLVVSGVEAA